MKKHIWNIYLHSKLYPHACPLFLGVVRECTKEEAEAAALASLTSHDDDEAELELQDLGEEA